MNAELYPAIEPLVTWRRFQPDAMANVAQGDSTFLYIGSDKSFADLFNSTYHAGFIVSSLLDCEQLFNELQRNQFPTIILIDVQVQRGAIHRFHSYLKQKKVAKNSIILCNEIKVTSSTLSYIKEHEMVDDVVSLNGSFDALMRKIAFLKKVKNSIPRRTSIAPDRMVRAISKEKRTLYLKRLFDIAFVSLLLLILFPVLLLIAIAIKLDSPGPVIYRSLRAGRGFKIFKFYKFRTMIVGADKKIEEYSHLNQYSGNDGDVKFIKIDNDPRITRLGRFLRNTSMDELPQLLNVLLGDMSLVGNRPLPLYEATTLTTNEHVERFMAPAGITGLWQIKKRGKAEMSAEERIRLDISYARKCNVLYDMWIVVNTPAALFQKTNA